jgi:hypothetical protein
MIRTNASLESHKWPAHLDPSLIGWWGWRDKAGAMKVRGQNKIVVNEHIAGVAYRRGLERRDEMRRERRKSETTKIEFTVSI